MDSLITIVAPIREMDVDHINTLIDALGNPARESIRDALSGLDENGDGTHFMSLHAIPAGPGEDAHLVLEFTADGGEARAVERIYAAIGPDLEPIFSLARDWRSNVGLLAYLRSHIIGVGVGLSDNVGLCFAGTPGMNVGRIRKECALASFVGGLVDNHRPDMRPIDRLAEIRRAVAASEFAWALDPPPPPLREGADKTVGQSIGAFLPDFASRYLWPFVLVFVVFLVLIWMVVGWKALWLAPLATLVLLIVIAAVIYAKLRAQEKSDWLEERALDPAIFLEMRKRENHCAQNHMASVTVRKPGFVRWLTLRLAFWVIGMMATRVFPPGVLGGISTIHAARWITIPGTRQLVFFSNFGGSWESYLEDFITKAHQGLTAVWSNSIGFPRASNLFNGGATDGERFKRYARHSMMPTRFWYSAYPQQTTDHVRGNATMRRGLAAALTNDEAAQFLSLFGSAVRPDPKLETSQIQSLVFGGLGFMKDGACLLYNLPDDQAKARAFIAGLGPDVGFGDGRKLRKPAVVTVALGANALPKLGLPEECVKGFAPAFLEGMHIEGRNRILGDTGVNGPEHWQWGREPYDLALLVYGYNRGAAGALERRIAELAEANAMAPPHRIDLEQTKKPAIEPFGFVDGISQPIIRGSYQSYRKNDPIHLVEPGEFVIGYPDNRANFPPEPELNPLLDPQNRLPVADKSRAFGNTIVEAPRAIGRNGTYLVIRQLEQDVTGFWDYCWSEYRRLKDRLPAPYDIRPDYIAAKLVGRWRDGSSLVRNPYYPFPKEDSERQRRRANRPNAEGYDEITAMSASGEPIGSETVRPGTNPADGSAIASPGPASAAPGAAAEPPGGAQDKGEALTESAGPPERSEVPKRDQKEGAPREEHAPVRYGDNDFLFGVEDPEALRCPFGAHIRRANPRDSLEPGSMEQVSISNRHRIYRLGRLYQPAEPDGKPGLLFMCLNGDIERQFEFIQQTWLVSPAFHGLTGEQDPLNSDGSSTGATCYTVPSNDGPVRLKPLPRFVRTLGGGYFFMPSRSLLAYLGEV